MIFLFVKQMFNFLLINFDFHLMSLFHFLQFSIFDPTFCSTFVQLFGGDIPKGGQSITFQLVVISLLTFSTKLFVGGKKISFYYTIQWVIPIDKWYNRSINASLVPLSNCLDKNFFANCNET